MFSMITRRSLFASLAGLAVAPAVAEAKPDTAFVEGLPMTPGQWAFRKRVVAAHKGQWPQWADMGRGLWWFKLHDPDKRTLVYDELTGTSRAIKGVYWGRMTDDWIGLDISRSQRDKGSE